jgi:hypothetical protein
MQTDEPTPGSIPDTASRLVTALIAGWRRTVADDGEMELTLPEAAAMLVVSLDTVCRQITRGDLDLRRDGAIASDPELAHLRRELQEAQRDLREALWQNAALASEVQALKANVLVQHAWGRELQSWPLGSPADVARQRAERLRITAKLDEARRLAGRDTRLSVY